MIRINRKSHGSGFTLIELLVVIAIIAMLVGLLSPAIKVVTRSAKGLKQKSTFHGYETGLEFYSKDFDGYPDSSRIPRAGGADQITGAQHLAEALLGRDLQGFDPKSRWYAPTDPKEAYAKNGINGATQDDEDKSLQRRKEQYVEMKDDGAYALEDLYGGAANIAPVYSPSGFLSPRAPVMTDIFARKRIELIMPGGATERIKVGSPVLYFRADQTSKKFSGSNPVVPYGDYIYNYDDNRAIVNLTTVRDDTVYHNYSDNPANTGTLTFDGKTFATGDLYFYYKIWNKRVDTYEKPYNPKTFLLISAGWDGIFGTKDDITNFNY